MSMMVDACEFLTVARPALRAGDASRLARAVKRRWTPRALCPLLKHDEVDVRRTAALTLGMVADVSCVGCLAQALHDADEQVNQMAEHALWSVWFRAGSAEAAEPFGRGVTLMSEELYEPAIRCFREAVKIDPGFAEAHNQCALAHFFIGRWTCSIKSCEKALGLMPAHFGAMSGRGHGYTQLGDLPQALDCYRRALAINPRMPAIRSAVERLTHRLDGGARQRVPASGLGR